MNANPTVRIIAKILEGSLFAIVIGLYLSISLRTANKKASNFFR